MIGAQKKSAIVGDVSPRKPLSPTEELGIAYFCLAAGVALVSSILLYVSCRLGVGWGAIVGAARAPVSLDIQLGVPFTRLEQQHRLRVARAVLQGFRAGRPVCMIVWLTGVEWTFGALAGLGFYVASFQGFAWRSRRSL